MLDASYWKTSPYEQLRNRGIKFTKKHLYITKLIIQFSINKDLENSISEKSHLMRKLPIHITKENTLMMMMMMMANIRMAIEIQIDQFSQST